MNIPEKAHKIKSWAGEESGQIILIILVLIVSNLISFKIGQNSIITTPDSSLSNSAININNNESDYSLSDPKINPGSLAAAIYQSQNSEPKREESTPQNNPSAGVPPRYVASKNGRVYYFTWCAGAKRIAEENRNYFNSSQDARAAGLTPSSACPDLD